MPHETVYIEAPLDFGKEVQPRHRRARTEIGIAVRSVSGEDVQTAYSVSMPNHWFDPIRFDVVRHDGRLWRPILGRWTAQDGHPSGEGAIELLSSSTSDNPLAPFVASGRGDVMFRNDDTPQRRAVEVSLFAASREVLLIDGVAHRMSHEPTWIVRSVDRYEKYVLVQADLERPGRTVDAVWFSADRGELALAFAREIAQHRDCELLGPRGEIVPTGAVAPVYDEREAAEARMESLWSSRNLALAGLDENEEVVAAITAHEGDVAADLPGTLLEIVSGLEKRSPATEVLLNRSRLPAAHLSFLKQSAVLRRRDEADLDVLLRP